MKITKKTARKSAKIVINKEPRQSKLYEMKIPDKIQIGGKEFKVEFKEEIKCKNNYNSAGIIKPTQGLIQIAEKTEYGKASKDSINHTFLHEVVHGILDTMSNDLSNDEKFVDTFSNILYQVIKQL